MKKHIWRIQARSYCWLPLIAFCAGLPAHADLLSYTATSDNVSGSLTVTGFDPSQGTLNSVTLDFRDGFSITIQNNSTVTNNYDIRWNNDATLTQPDGSTQVPTGQNYGLAEGSLDPGAQAGPFGTPIIGDSSYLDPSILAEYTTLSVSLAYDVGDSGIDAADSTLPAGFDVSIPYTADLTVTYDYTPDVSAVPEPTAGILLGTLAAICFGASRKRFARGGK